MTVATASIVPRCPENRADLYRGAIAKLPERSPKRSHPCLKRRFAELNLDTCPQVLAVERADHERGTAACQVRSLRVLLVEDDQLVAKLLGVLLRLDGHDAQVARDGPAALRHVQVCRPDVILLDIALPGMDGYEVAGRLRACDDTKQIFLAALTGYGRKEDREQSGEAGFDHHLVKPVDFVDLRRMLTSVANSRKEVF
jgi:CheY-like chemotaxis protein